VATVSVFETVSAAIAEHLKIDPATVMADSSLREGLGADSLDAVEILMAIEDRLRITIPDDEAQKFKTVGDIVAFVERATQAKP